MKVRIVLAALVIALTDAAWAARPNFILLMTDDQGYGDLSCHGNPILPTPHLDRLHRESVRLTNFHVDPACAPTRAALMTGRYSHRVGVWRWLNDYFDDHYLHNGRWEAFPVYCTTYGSSRRSASPARNGSNPSSSISR
jgi:hypothetical protein